MNEISKFAAPETVTTGSIVGSRKVYAAPKGRPDISVPFREIALSDPNEPPVRVYDPSGPYTESAARIDLAAGLAPAREAWIAARGYAAIEGRAIRPEDNGAVSGDNLAPLCPARRSLRAGKPGQPGRHGSIDDEMEARVSFPCRCRGTCTGLSWSDRGGRIPVPSAPFPISDPARRAWGRGRSLSSRRARHRWRFSSFACR